MIIEIFQDTICPWCRIGKKHLFDALKQWNGEAVEIRYRAFQLNPDTPKEGVPFLEYMSSMKGGPDAAKQMVQHAANAGAASGVPFQFEKVTMWPNTLASHQLIKLAPPEKQTEVVDAVYRAYFEEGKDIGQAEVLLSIASALGMDQNETKQRLEKGEGLEEIEADLQYAQELEITGVPFFVIDRKLALSGAHPVENFLKAFQQVTEAS
ncbi:DsbA family oxidoreductase [Brevibacillus ruminantium]|uniref:DsbA family oxidoreductase n=1 Tax=Brevibacillus ruminantium TaxID=2950604 RepID=A0ABY4WDN6_9BACL|nr:DsbA family oxidoreductase [Brevibacillus ruminantium]USG63394.1 DsbA family oxidoreductase [Brevibacillus ruminantium]